MSRFIKKYEITNNTGTHLYWGLFEEYQNNIYLVFCGDTYSRVKKERFNSYLEPIKVNMIGGDSWLRVKGRFV